MVSIDYDAHRTTPENEATEPIEELKARKTRPAEPVIDLDEAELADSFETIRIRPL